jgi:hypothetical protein
MALDDVINAQEKFGKIASIADAYTKRAPISIADELLGYMGGEMNRDEVTKYRNYTEDQLRNDIHVKRKESQEALISSVREKYDESLDSVPEEALIGLVLTNLNPATTGNAEHDAIAEIHKKYLKIKEELKAGDFREYKKDLKSRAKGIYESFERNLSADKDWAGLAEGYVRDMSGRLQLQFHELDGEGKPTARIDVKKLRKYVTDTISKYQEQDKNDAYFLIGTAVKKKE